MLLYVRFLSPLHDFTLIRNLKAIKIIGLGMWWITFSVINQLAFIFLCPKQVVQPFCLFFLHLFIGKRRMKTLWFFFYLDTCECCKMYWILICCEYREEQYFISAIFIASDFHIKACLVLLQFTLLHFTDLGFFTNGRQYPSSVKRFTTCFIVIHAFLGWSGT